MNDVIQALYNYFRTELAQGKIDFCVRATMDGTAIEFYIRPDSKNGQTVSFRLDHVSRVELLKK